MLPQLRVAEDDGVVFKTCDIHPFSFLVHSDGEINEGYIGHYSMEYF